MYICTVVQEASAVQVFSAAPAIDARSHAMLAEVSGVLGIMGCPGILAASRGLPGKAESALCRAGVADEMHFVF